MAQQTTQTVHTQKDANTATGCCGGHKASDDTKARPEPQAVAKKPVAKSGGCCCS